MKLLLYILLIIIFTTTNSFALKREIVENIRLYNQKNQDIFIKNKDVNSLNCNVASNYLVLGDYKNAIKYYDIAVKIVDKSNNKDGLDTLLINLSLAQVLNNSVSEANKNINKSLKINPKNFEALAVLPLILEAKGNKKEALSLINKNCTMQDQIACAYLKRDKKDMSFSEFFKLYNYSRFENKWNTDLKFRSKWK